MREPSDIDLPELFDDVARTPTPRPRQQGSRIEREMYIEDVLDIVSNKYLAVNIASRRARALNERELPIGESARHAKKPTTQALLELMEGHLKFELIPLRPLAGDADTDIDDDTDADIAAMFEELEEGDSDDFDIADVDSYDEDS